MARDPIIGDSFTPSVAIPVARRRPLADHLRGEWNLSGVKPHTGANSLGDLSLMPTEQRILAELLRAYQGGGLESGWKFQAALERAHVDNSEYWLSSLMVKLGVSSVMGLIEVAQADPLILKAPEPGDGFGPGHGIGQLAGR